MVNLKEQRLNETRTNRYGLEMRIIEYKNNKEVKVLFPTSGVIRNTTYWKFKRGQVYPTWRNRKAKQYDEVEPFEDDYDNSNNIGIVACKLVGLLAIGGIAIYTILKLLSVI